MKIGVFDSGKGGLSVVKAIRKELPKADIIFKDDSKNVPYGLKSPEEIYKLIVPIFNEFIRDNVDIIVVACNTVSTTLINKLREDFPSVPFIAMEPMIKPAAKITNNNVIAVCATPTTLSSKRYKYLKETFAPGIRVIEPDCSQWSYLIEHKQINEQIVRSELEPALNEGADVIVLGCTHYHWIEQLIKQIAKDRAVVIQPEVPVINQLKRVIEQLS